MYHMHASILHMYCLVLGFRDMSSERLRKYFSKFSSQTIGSIPVLFERNEKCYINSNIFITFEEYLRVKLTLTIK